MKRVSFLRRAAVLLAVLMLCGAAALAADVHLAQDSVYCLSQSDFAPAGTQLGGIYVADVPSQAVCRVVYGTRSICAGDVLPCSALDELALQSVGDVQMECALVYRPITQEGLGLPQQLSLRLTGSQNTAPVAQDGTLETYKNIAREGAVSAQDAEGDALTYQLVRQARRGEAELAADGTFVYTPKENKVGKDSFTFTATDAAGNVSEEATVKIRIVKPTDAALYTDVRGASCEYAAMWLKEAGAYTGRTVAGQLCFGPEESVGRGEFLTAAMYVLHIQPEDAMRTSGFADEQDAPAWMQPYITSALKLGAIGGSVTEEGLLFRPAAALTRAEAAVMTANLLRLPQEDAQSVFAADGESAVPTWAAGACAALADAGVELNVTQAGAITRAEAAQLLCDAAMLRENS